MFNMSGYCVSFRGPREEDSAPEGAALVIEGEDLGTAEIAVLSESGDVLRQSDAVPPDAMAKFLEAARLVADGQEIEAAQPA